jgi:hypothetical protein
MSWGEATYTDLDAAVGGEREVLCPAGVLSILVVHNHGAGGSTFPVSP